MLQNLLIIFLFICSTSVLSDTSKRDPDEFRTPEELINSRGYKSETHYVTTEDGYILALHRIINPLLPKGNLRPIILQHGLLCSGIDFILNSPGGGINSSPLYRINDIDKRSDQHLIGNNLGFVLSSIGYDVWLSNSRGNTYSTNHTSLNPKHDSKFWEFTFDEMIEYDLPAVIKYILNETSYESLGYIGHSQGTLIMFGLLSTRPEYSNIIKPFIALAPLTKVKHIKSPIKLLAKNPFLMGLFKYEGGPFLPSNEIITYLADSACTVPMKSICYNILFFISGFDLKQLNVSRLPVYFAHTPAGTSSWNMVHYGQNYLSGKFAKFDLGKRLNIKKYGVPMPPEYPLEMINSTNIALLYSDNDWLADPKDVNTLKKSLKTNLIADYKVPYHNWNHLDFIWGKDAGHYINSYIIKILKQYNF